MDLALPPFHTSFLRLSEWRCSQKPHKDFSFQVGINAPTRNLWALRSQYATDTLSPPPPLHNHVQIKYICLYFHYFSLISRYCYCHWCSCSSFIIHIVSDCLCAHLLLGAVNILCCFGLLWFVFGGWNNAALSASVSVWGWPAELISRSTCSSSSLLRCLWTCTPPWILQLLPHLN